MIFWLSISFLNTSVKTTFYPWGRRFGLPLWRICELSL
ncbi:Uncharacterised protein [Vibrio cholerae]|nr:Uncharacterised protein [Vibrio cholerae]